MRSDEESKSIDQEVSKHQRKFSAQILKEHDLSPKHTQSSRTKA